MNRQQTRDFLLGLFSEWFQIRDLEPVIQWARREVRIPESISPVAPGPYDPDVAPLASIALDWFLDSRYRELIVPKSSQCGVSQAMQVLTCYIAAHQMGDILWCLESSTKAKELNQERLKPMITQACRVLDSQIFEDGDKLQNKVLWLRGLKILMAGARSAGQVASRTIPYIFGDEVDEWLTELQGGESNALDLLRERAKLVPWAKLAFFSKPRNAMDPELARGKRKGGHSSGIIWQEYLQGTRHKCLIPCPHCGHQQELVREGLRYQHCKNLDGKLWDFSKVLAETYYECEACHQKIDEQAKIDAVLRRRIWKQTNFADDPDRGDDDDLPRPGVMSVHISDLYANSRVFPELTMGNLALKIVSAKTVSQEHSVMRGSFALPVQLKTLGRQKAESILAMQGRYRRGTFPERPDFTAILIDVQHAKQLKWVKMGFRLDDTAWIADHGIQDIFGPLDEMVPPGRSTPQALRLKSLMDVPIHCGDTADTVTCVFGLIDEGDGNSKKTVLDLCTDPALYRRLTSAKGRGGRQTDSMADRVMLQGNRMHEGKLVDRYLFDADYFKDELYEERVGKLEAIQKAETEGLPLPAPRLYFYERPEGEFVKEFTAERKDYYMKDGRLAYGWVPDPDGPNDFSDCVVEGLALWYRSKPILLKAKTASESAKKE